jgi:hypothetical protein
MSSSEIAGLINGITNKCQFYSSIVILIILIFTTLKMFRDNRSAYYLAIESTTDIGLLLGILPYNIVGYVLK